MNTHTPGPWTREENDGRIFGADGIAVAATWGSGMRGRGTDVLEANARLIAAAPDLLEACKAAVAIEPGNYPNLAHLGIAGDCHPNCARCKVEAAIAKAQGTQPCSST